MTSIVALFRSRKGRASLFAHLKASIESKLEGFIKLAYGVTDQAFSIGAIFVSNIVLARVTSEGEYGSFVLVYSIFTFLAGIHNALLLEPFTIFSSGKYRAHFEDYLQLALRINITSGIILAIFLLIIASAFSVYNQNIFVPSIYGLAVSILFLLSGSLFRRVFYVELDAASAALISIIFFIVVVIGLAILVKAEILTGFSLFLLLTIGWVVASPVFIWRHKFNAGSKRFLENNVYYWREHWNYARWVLATALVFQLINQGYYWIVAILLNVDDVARLKAVQNVVLPMTLLFGSITLTILPRMSLSFHQNSISGLRIIVFKMIKPMLFIAVIFFALILIFGKELLDLLYSGKYTNSIKLLFIVALNPIILCVGNMYNDALKAMEQPKWVFFAYVFGGGVTIIMGIPMVFYSGLSGAAWGTVLSSLGYMILLAYGFHYGARLKSEKMSEHKSESPRD